MSSNHTEIMIPVHGGLHHSVCILICKYICMRRGYTLKNPEGFSRLAKSPGIPDVYIAYQYKGKNDYGRTISLEKSVCIEIEMNPTSTSILKKNEQFSRPGMREPIIIDMGKEFKEYKDKETAKGNTQPDDIAWIEAYIDRRLVL